MKNVILIFAAMLLLSMSAMAQTIHPTFKFDAYVDTQEFLGVAHVEINDTLMVITMTEGILTLPTVSTPNERDNSITWVINDFGTMFCIGSDGTIIEPVFDVTYNGVRYTFTIME
jgi:hypothetical protein